jgi:hypothetical protein
MEKQIKALLSSPDEKKQRLGCKMAKSTLKWSNFDIIMYVMNTRKGWKFEKESFMVVYHINFLGQNIRYGCLRSENNMLYMQSKNQKRLWMYVKKHQGIEYLKNMLKIFIEENI